MMSLIRKIMLEFCEHSLCGFEDREEYCNERARDPEGIPVIVAEVIEDLIYPSPEQLRASDKSWFSINGQTQLAERTISYLSLDEHILDTWPIRTEVQLSHTKNKQLLSDHYVVDVSWKPDHDDKIGEFHTRYSVDIYASGGVQSQIEEPAYHGGYEERQMTPYDFEKLFEGLMALQELPQEKAEA